MSKPEIKIYGESVKDWRLDELLDVLASIRKARGDLPVCLGVPGSDATADIARILVAYGEVRIDCNATDKKYPARTF